MQHLFGSMYKSLASSSLKQGLKDGDALSTYLINLMDDLDGFVQMISVLPDKNISNPDIMLHLVNGLLQSTGLTPLLPLLSSDQPLNASAAIDIASKIGNLIQPIFTFNETDPTMPELEGLIMKFLSTEGNLTIFLSNIMGSSLLTYSKYVHPQDIARVREAIHPFTNQTSAGIVEAILRAMELLKTVMDSPNGDPTQIILGYISQLQEFVISLCRLQLIQHPTLPSGQLPQITDLHQISKDFFSLLTPEGLQNLTEAGPDNAQNIIIKKFVAFLPPDVQIKAGYFLQNVKALQDKMAECAEGRDCVAGFSEIFTFLEKIVDMMLSTNGSVTITLGAPNSVMRMQEYEEIASIVFPLLLSANDAEYITIFGQTLHFIRLVMSAPNITVSDVQNAFRQSNLTIEDLKNIARLAGAANINDLFVSLMQIINARQCFEPQNNAVVTAHCVQHLIHGVIGFLTRVPALQNETAILSFIPTIVNSTVSEVIQANLSSNPTMVVVHILNISLANVKMTLQLNNLNTTDVMNEIRVLESLIQLAANPLPFNSSFNTTMAIGNPLYSQMVYLQIIDWYLKRVVDITRNSSFSDLIHPFLSVTQMQVTLQLAQTNFSLFVNKQVEYLLKNLQFPLNGQGLHKIGLTSVEIFRRLFEVIMFNIELQSNLTDTVPSNITNILHATKIQVKLYLDLIENWMKQPNVPLVLTSLLHWGNNTMNISTPVKDLHLLLQTMGNLLNNDQLAYLSIISNVTKHLSKALMVAEQPGGLQSDHFLAALVEAVKNAMQILTQATEPLPLSVQQNIVDIVHNSLKLFVQPNMSFASSRNISLIILKKAESVIQQIIPGMLGQYVLSGLKVAVTYFETISTTWGSDNWNQL